MNLDYIQRFGMSDGGEGQARAAGIGHRRASAVLRGVAFVLVATVVSRRKDAAGSAGKELNMEDFQKFPTTDMAGEHYSRSNSSFATTHFVERGPGNVRLNANAR